MRDWHIALDETSKPGCIGKSDNHISLRDSPESGTIWISTAFPEENGLKAFRVLMPNRGSGSGRPEIFYGINLVGSMDSDRRVTMAKSAKLCQTPLDLSQQPMVIWTSAKTHERGSLLSNRIITQTLKPKPADFPKANTSNRYMSILPFSRDKHEDPVPIMPIGWFRF
jgi:hypothetical protein